MITPQQLAKDSEESHQAAIFCWSAIEAQRRPELKLLFSIPNGGLRNKITAARLKATGAKAGVPDIFLPVARGSWHGLFVELKRCKSEGKQRGYASPDQKLWVAALLAQGYGVVVAVGWEEARDMILSYLDWKGN